MSLESATYINQLNPLNPDGSVDLVSTADDHLRLIKSTLQNSFPGVTGVVNATQSDLSSVQYLTDTGTTNAVVVSPSPAWTAYAAGNGLVFKAANSSTGTVTIKVNALAPITLVSSDASNPPIVAGAIYAVRYDGTNFQMMGDHSSTFKTIIDTTVGTSLGANSQIKIAPVNNTTNTLGRGSQMLFGATFQNAWASYGTDYVARYAGSIQYIPNEVGTAARNHRLSFSTSSSADDTLVERMSILTGGNIGIGTTAPAYSLDIAGNLNVNQTSNSGFGITVVGNNTNSARIGYVLKNSLTTNRETVSIKNTVISDVAGSEQTDLVIQTGVMGTFKDNSTNLYYAVTGTVWSAGSLKISFNAATTFLSGISITLSGMSPSAYNGTYTVLASPAPGSGYVYVTVADNGKTYPTLTDKISLTGTSGITIGTNTIDGIGLGVAASPNDSTTIAKAISDYPFKFTNGSDTNTLNVFKTGSYWTFRSVGSVITLNGNYGVSGAGSVDFGDNSASGYNVSVSGNLSVASNIIAGSGRTWNNSTGEVISKTTLRARVYFAGSASPTVYAIYNGTLTRNGVGDYTLTFANTLPASVSSTACVIGNIALSTALGNQYLLYTYAKSTSAISFKIINPSGTAVDTPDMVEIIVFG